MSNRLGNRTRLLGSGASGRVAQWFQRSQVKSIQRGTIAIAAVAASNTAAITAVVLANSRLRHLGSTSNNAAGAPSAASIRLELTNATTITATRITTGAADVVVSYEIIEYWPGVIKSVQRGTIALVSVATNTATITTVNTAKTELDDLGCTVGADLDTLSTRIVLTNATTITATRISTAATLTTVSYQAIEWY